MANIKLLLLEDEEALGRKGDIVTVAPGHARNWLLPQKIAILADKRALVMQARLQEARAKQAIVDKRESEHTATALKEVVVSIVVKVDREGHMYGSVSAKDILHLLEEQQGMKLEKKAVQLAHPIKETGVYPINVKLKEDVAASFTLKVVPDHVVGEMPHAGHAEQAESQNEKSAT